MSAISELETGSFEDDRMKEQSKKNSDKKFWVILAVIVLSLVGIRLFVLDWIWISGESMLPTLEDGELVLAEKISKSTGGISYGDVVIVSYPDGMQCVKRVLGMEGDILEIHDKQVFRNGQAIEEPYLYEETFRDMQIVTVPKNTVFVMGDKRNNSTDSRMVGPIPMSRVIGHVFAVIYPFDKIKGVV